jgi:phosphate transport system protein
MDSSGLDFTGHISQQFNNELSELKNHLLVMGGLVEQQVIDAVQAFISLNTGVAMEIKGRDADVDKLEVLIDEECVQVIAKRQPAARDLRLVVSVAKMVSDLERIGDEAKKIAKIAIAMTEDGELPRACIEVRNIGQHVARMVHDALDCFARLDVDAALEIIKEDKLVDQEYKSATRALITFMMEDPRSISRILNVMWVLRSLERVGDHAGNIAEHVIYMVKGEDVRHVPINKVQEVINKKS